MKDIIDDLSFNKKGNYVLISILRILKGEQLDELSWRIIKDLKKHVYDSYGVCIINKVIEHT